MTRLTNGSRRLGEYTASFGWRAGARYFIRDQSRRERRVSIVWPALRHPVEVRLGKPGADLRTFTQVFVAREYDFELQHEPAVIVDAGAHIGCASLWLGRRYPKAKIIAIEPDRENFELLEHNIDPYPNITAIQGALWGRHGNLALMDPGHGSWGYRVKENAESDDMIPAVTINDILAKFDLSRIDVLKLDIEGAEVEVFRSSETWIERVDAIIIELHDRHTPGCSGALFRATEDFDIETRRGENLALMRTPAGRTSFGEAHNVAARLATDP